MYITDLLQRLIAKLILTCFHPHQE